MDELKMLATIIEGAEMALLRIALFIIFVYELIKFLKYRVRKSR